MATMPQQTSRSGRGKDRQYLRSRQGEGQGEGNNVLNLDPGAVQHCQREEAVQHGRRLHQQPPKRASPGPPVLVMHSAVQLWTSLARTNHWRGIGLKTCLTGPQTATTAQRQLRQGPLKRYILCKRCMRPQDQPSWTLPMQRYTR